MSVASHVHIEPRTAITPLDALARWPSHVPVLMLHSGNGPEPWARWSILARPSAWYRFDGRSSLTPLTGCEHLPWSPPLFTHNPLDDLDALLHATRATEIAVDNDAAPPFTRGWIGNFSYTLGSLIEPVARHQPRASAARSDWPHIELAWCAGALAYDHVTRQWHIAGEIDDALADHVLNSCEDTDRLNSEPLPVRLSPLTPDGEPGDFSRMVEHAIRYIEAGDVFQVNLAQRFTCEVHGLTRALASRLLGGNEPWFGAYLEPSPDADGTQRTLLSISPELFLRASLPGGEIVTRPIKGTRPAAGSQRALRESTKDAAELHMIVDLMRNDLGRVCRYGSVQVTDARCIETHATVHHGVAEVRGILRPDVSVSDILRAAFPPGSVTGAPKIRAMQIIDELEPVARGPYCGAIGFISDHGSIELNVAIRTCLLHGLALHDRTDSGFHAQMEYFAGCGIVADSDPQAEWQECLDKTQAVRVTFAQE